MCQNKTDYDNAINDLKTSPMFNLSLSSKELFHSNFLYWIAQKDKSAFKALIEALEKDVNEKDVDWPENEDNWEVCREHKNFDLCVCEKETKKELIVIENKFKSLPDKAQLDKYDKKLQNNTNCKKILLSLTEPFIEKQDNWQWKSYQPLVKKLYEIKDKFNNKYDKSLIKDYCGFVNNIITLTRMWIAKDKQDGATFLLDYKADDLKHEEDSGSKGNNYNECQYYNDAKELRIHDLYGKYRTERLRVMLQDKIDELSERNGLEIITNTAYTRSLPILEVVIRGVEKSKDTENNKEPEAFFISIQGNQYRHAINAREDINTYSNKVNDMTLPASWSDNVKSSVLRIKEKGDKWNWFLNYKHSPNHENNKCFDIKGSNVVLANSGQRNKVCSFAGKGGVNYIYQYKKIKAKATIKQVLDLMVHDVKNIINEFTPKL